MILYTSVVSAVAFLSIFSRLLSNAFNHGSSVIVVFLLQMLQQNFNVVMPCVSFRVVWIGPLCFLARGCKRGSKPGLSSLCYLGQVFCLFFVFMVYVVCWFLAFGCQYQCSWLPGKTRLQNDRLFVESLTHSVWSLWRGVLTKGVIGKSVIVNSLLCVENGTKYAYRYCRIGILTHAVQLCHYIRPCITFKGCLGCLFRATVSSIYYLSKRLVTLLNYSCAI